jgi:hypothetical protein
VAQCQHLPSKFDPRHQKQTKLKKKKKKNPKPKDTRLLFFIIIRTKLALVGNEKNVFLTKSGKIWL